MINGEANAAELDVLRSAERDGLPPERRVAILGALGVAAPAALGDGFLGDGVGSAGDGGLASEGLSSAANQAAATHGLGATGLAGGGSGAGLLTLAGAGVVGAASFWGVVHLTTPSDAPPVEPPPEVVHEAPMVEPPVLVADEFEQETQADTVDPAGTAVDESESTASHAARQPSVSKAQPDSLSREFALIEAARSALNRKDGAATLRRLHEYDAQFPSGKLRAEAMMLRIEGLVVTGQRARAARLGETVLKVSPNGPYSRRIRSLLGDLDDEDESRP